MSDGGKGSVQRPTDMDKFSANYDTIEWKKPEGADGSCGFPFCICKEKCEEKNELRKTSVSD